MADNFDFEAIGKNMPYRVPENFFSDFEEDVARQLDMANCMVVRRKPLWQLVMRPFVAAAAVAAVVALLLTFSPVNQNQMRHLTVEQAFAELSDADQEYLLDVYQDVTYISEQL